MNLILVVAALVLGQTSPVSADTIAVDAVRSVAAVDLAKVKGDPVRLAWSPDETELYVQVADRDTRGAIKSAKHFIVSVADGKIKGVDAEPTWASKYWAWKSGQTSPSTPAFKIAVDSRQETVRATAAPTGGAMARGVATDPNAGTTVGDVANAAGQSQTQVVYTLRIGREQLGEWVNEAVIPGLTFGWAPAPQRLIAFARRDGGSLVILDDQDRKQSIAGSKDALLPAWSDDGARLAWAERKDRKHLDIRVADIRTK